MIFKMGLLSLAALMEILACFLVWLGFWQGKQWALVLAVPCLLIFATAIALVDGKQPTLSFATYAAFYFLGSALVHLLDVGTQVEPRVLLGMVLTAFAAILML